jgi:hypothetical protein
MTDDDDPVRDVVRRGQAAQAELKRLRRDPTMPAHYMLDADGTPRRCDDVMTWARWFETADRTIAQDRDEAPGAPAVCVSTVFLGLDHDWFGPGPPILWETLVFGGPLDGEMKRYRSRDDAIVGHQEMCRRVAAAGSGSRTKPRP